MTIQPSSWCHEAVYFSHRKLKSDILKWREEMILNVFLISNSFITVKRWGTVNAHIIRIYCCFQLVNKHSHSYIYFNLLCNVQIKARNRDTIKAGFNYNNDVLTRIWIKMLLIVLPMLLSHAPHFSTWYIVFTVISNINPVNVVIC